MKKIRFEEAFLFIMCFVLMIWFWIEKNPVIYFGDLMLTIFIYAGMRAVKGKIDEKIPTKYKFNFLGEMAMLILVVLIILTLHSPVEIAWIMCSITITYAALIEMLQKFLIEETN